MIVLIFPGPATKYKNVWFTEGDNKDLCQIDVKNHGNLNDMIKIVFKNCIDVKLVGQSTINKNEIVFTFSYSVN